MGLFRPAPYGVDLGGGSLKVVRLKGQRVVVAAFIDIPEEIREVETRTINILRDFLKGIGASGKQAVVQLPGGHAFIRTVNFPPMPRGELNEAVAWEVKRQSPYPPEDTIYDYVAVQTEEGLAVTFASAERKAVLRHIFPFKEAGLDVVALDISPLCLLRSLKPKSPGNTIILDIGAVSTEINIAKGSVLRLSRTVDIGGNFIKQHFLGAGASPADAEKSLREGGEEELKAPLDEFLKEIARSMDYYTANFKEKTFAEAVLTGGVSINPAVKSYFSRALGIPVDAPSPFEGYEMADETMRGLGPRFSVALGLARRAG